MSAERMGGLLIVAAAFGGALRYLGRVNAQLRLLREIALMLELMQGELQSWASPMAELLEQIENRIPGPCADFAQNLRQRLDELGTHSFSALWKDALRDTLADAGPTALDSLRELGQVLGRYDCARQCAALEACRREIQTLYAQSSALLPVRRRLVWGLSLTCAALLVIVLM